MPRNRFRLPLRSIRAFLSRGKRGKVIEWPREISRLPQRPLGVCVLLRNAPTSVIASGIIRNAAYRFNIHSRNHKNNRRFCFSFAASIFIKIYDTTRADE